MARASYKAPTYELSPQQVEAVELLLTGFTVTATAAALGVSRETVTRWRHSDPGFEAAYNAGLLSAWEASHKRLLDTRGKAIDKLAELLDSDDPAIALKASAALVKINIERPNGSVDADKVARSHALSFF